MDDLPPEAPVTSLNASTAASPSDVPQSERKKFSLSLVKYLVHQVQETTGHRFWNKGRATYHNTMKASNHCCQDILNNPSDAPNGKTKGRKKMERFDCKSVFYIAISSDSRSFRIRFHHHYHPPYDNGQPSPEVMQFIDERALSSTAASIFRDLRIEQVPGWDLIEKHQLYYRWRMINLEARKRADGLK